MKFAIKAKLLHIDNKIFVDLNINLENYLTPRRCKE